MDNQIQEYRNRGLNNLQINEVIEGFKNGLTIEKVDLYAKGEYTHLQMRQIRLALQDNLTDDQLATFMRPEIKADVMEHIRIKTTTGNVIDERKKAELNKVKIRNAFWLMSLPVIISLGALVFFVASRYISADQQELYLTLTSDIVELEYGDVFNAMDYVESYTKSPITELILPENLETDRIGKHALCYKLVNPLKSIEKELTVRIVDKTPPVIKLTKSAVTLKKGKDTLNAVSFIENADDLYDGDLREVVKFDVLAEASGKQRVLYYVSDSSGNRSEAVLYVTWIIPTPEPTPVQTASSKPNSKDTSRPSTNKNSNNSKQASKPTAVPKPSATPKPVKKKGSKDFLFRDGYNLDSGFSACQAAGDKHRKYSCTPMKNDEGIYIGYHLDWED